VLLMTLLSLAPLDNGQSTFLLFGTAMQWARAQESGWSILGHTLPVTPTTAPVVAAPPPASLPQSQYVAVAQQDAINAGIPPNYFVRQINQESGFNPNAVSPAGAVGIAQFLPSTAAGLGINPWDPLQSLQAAAHLMASYSNQYGGDYAMALAAYNAGTGTVQYAINTCGAANWMNCLPAETQNYIYTIMGV
jgi:soluble lytic murein transglycosylase-like protein